MIRGEDRSDLGGRLGTQSLELVRMVDSNENVERQRTVDVIDFEHSRLWSTRKCDS